MSSRSETEYFISTSGNTILIETPKFQYEEVVYLIYPKEKRMEQYMEKTINRNTPLKVKTYTKYKRKKGVVIMITLDWVGAPKSFLTKYKFKPLNLKEWIKQQKSIRKPKKKK